MRVKALLPLLWNIWRHCNGWLYHKALYWNAFLTLLILFQCGCVVWGQSGRVARGRTDYTPSYLPCTWWNVVLPLPSHTGACGHRPEFWRWCFRGTLCRVMCEQSWTVLHFISLEMCCFCLLKGNQWEKSKSITKEKENSPFLQGIIVIDGSRGIVLRTGSSEYFISLRNNDESWNLINMLLSNI